MNDIQESLFQFASSVAAGSQSKDSQILDCTIERVLDAGQGIYSVNHLGAIFQAYSNSLIYNVGDEVYALKTSENSSTPSLILGMSRPNKSSKTPATITKDSKYLVIAGNILGNQNIYADINSFKDYPNSKIKVQDYSDRRNASIRFANAIKNYKTFALRFDVRTDLIPAQQLAGNYGVKLKISFEKEDKTYILDQRSYEGDMYSLEEYTTQTLYFSLGEGEKFVNTSEIQVEAFKEGFPNLNANVTQDDIFIKNIGLYAVLELSQEQINGGVLTVESDTGNMFLEKDEIKTLKAKLHLGGKVVADVEKTYDCYWFIEDPYTVVGSEYYHPHGGPGWKILNSYEEVKTYNSENEQESKKKFNVTKFSTEIKAEAVHSSCRFKCVIVDKEGKKYYNTITLSKLQPDYSFTLGIKGYPTSNIPIGLREMVLTCLTTVGEDDKDITLDYKWKRYDKAGSEMSTASIEPLNLYEYDEQQKGYLGTFKVSAANIVDSNKFVCYISKKVKISEKEIDTFDADSDGNLIETKQVICEYDTTYLGSASIVVTKVEGAYVLQLINADRLFKYDTDGDSPLVGNYDGPEANRIKNIEPLDIAIYRTENGEELTEEEYALCTVTWKIPVDSMFVLNGQDKLKQENGYYIISYNKVKNLNLPYSILPQYKPTLKNNTIVVEVLYRESIESNVVLKDTTNITFAKDGENGIGGGKYAAQITYNGRPYEAKDINGLPYKLRLFYNTRLKKWQYCYDNNHLLDFTEEGVSLGLNVYKAGSKIEDLSGYTAEWSLVDTDERDENVIPLPHTNAVVRMSANSSTILPRLVNNFYDEDTKQFLDTCTIVQCIVTIGKSNEDKYPTDEKLIAYYPIEVIGIDNEEITEDKKDSFIPLMVGGFEEATYALSGEGAQYDSDSPFQILLPNILEAEVTKDFEYRWKHTDSLEPIKEKMPTEEGEEYLENKYYAIPRRKFDTAITKNWIKAQITTSGESYDTDVLQKLKDRELERDSWLELNVVFDKFKSELEKNLSSFNINNQTDTSKSIKTILNNLNSIGFFQALDRVYYQNYKRDLNLQRIDSDKKKYNVTAVDGKTIASKVEIESLINKILLLPVDSKSTTTTPTVSAQDLQKWKDDIVGRLSTLQISGDDDKKNTAEYQALLNDITIYNEGISEFKKVLSDDTSVIDTINTATYILTVGRQIKMQLNQLIATLNKYPSEEWIDKTYKDDEKHDTMLKLLREYEFEDELNYLQLPTKGALYNSYFNAAFNSHNDQSKLHNYDAIIKCIDSINTDLTGKTTGIAVVDTGVLVLQDRIQKLFGNTKKLFTNAYDALVKTVNSLQKAKGIALSKIVYYKPIMVHIDTVGFSYLSDYTGTKIYTGGNGEDSSFLYAPQLGACIKENGALTGMVMGKRTTTAADADVEIGLFGYNKSLPTFFLDARTGKAEFGVSGKGQVIIDPNKSNNEGLIYGGNVNADDVIENKDYKYIFYTEEEKNYSHETAQEHNKGMLLNLTKPAICWGSGKFSVNEYGTLHAQNAYVEGHIEATSGNFSGNLEAKTGSIGGWNIAKDALWHEDDNGAGGTVTEGMGLWGNSIETAHSAAFWAGTKGDPEFWVSHTGDFHAIKGTIGGWTINDNSISSYHDAYDSTGIGRVPAHTVTLANASNGYADFLVVHINESGASDPDPFYVRGNGFMHSTSGEIGGFHIEDNVLWTAKEVEGGYDFSTESGMFRYGATKVKDGVTRECPAFYAGAWNGLDAPFYVTHNGYLHATQLDASTTSTFKDIIANTVTAEYVQARQATFTSVSADNITAGAIKAKNGVTIGGMSIQDKCLRYEADSNCYVVVGDYSGTSGLTVCGYQDEGSSTTSTLEIGLFNDLTYGVKMGGRSYTPTLITDKDGNKIYVLGSPYKK